jgi:uncharacterized protein (TIGR02271 family)
MTGEDHVLPLASEAVEITRRRLATGRVRVRVAPVAREEPIEVTLREQTVEVERVPVGRFVDQAPPVRTEGDVTVIPVVEERAVVTIRLFLREELRVRQQTRTRVERRSVTLRTEQAEVERLGPIEGDDSHE